MLKRLLWLFILALAVMGGLRPAQAQAARPGLIPAACPPIGADGYDFECGYVNVPADHANPDGGELFQIAVTIVHKRGTQPRPDPMVYINGGPGGKTLDILPYFLNKFDPFLQDRDIVFFDMRGVGQSRPALECSELAKVFGSESDPAMRPKVLDAARACHDNLIAHGIDVNLFNSAQVAGDVAVMREALGYPEWNLYGISYGTRTALTILRDHPAGVRSAILDAVIPPEADLFAGAAPAGDKALRGVAALCAANPVCFSAYPDTPATLDRVMARLNADPHPMTFTLADGEVKTVRMDGDSFKGVLLNMTAGPDGVASIPALVANADRGDFKAVEPFFKAIAEAQKRRDQNPTTPGQAFSVACAEEFPFTALDKSALGAANSNGLGLPDFCMVWGVWALGEIENQPVTSAVPTLLLHGEFDPLADPDWARGAASRLTRSTLIILPLAGHGAPGGCPVGIMRRYLDDPTGPLDQSCVDRMDDHFQWIINGDPARRVAGGLALAALLPGLAMTIYGGALAIGMARNRAISWQMTIQRVGWWPLIASLAGTAAFYFFGQFIEWKPTITQALAVAAPLMIGIQTALALSPSDEPMLEVALAAPQPFARLKLGQIAALLLSQAGLSLIVMVMAGLLAGENIGLGLIEWIGPALFMCGLAAVVTARSRQSAVGALVAIMAAFGLTQAGPKLMPAEPLGQMWPAPLSLIQPYVWLINPFLRSDALAFADYLANRAIVSALGAAMIAAALWLLSRTERVLMGALEK